MRYPPIYPDPQHRLERPGEIHHCSHWHANVGPCCFCKQQRLRESDNRDCTTKRSERQS